MSRFDRFILVGTDGGYPARAFIRGRYKPCTLEGGGGGSQPQSPDPWTTSAAQYQYGTQAAAYNKSLNLGDYSNPFGSQTSTKVGTDPATGAPIYHTDISASAPLQAGLNQGIGQASQFSSQINPGGADAYAQQGQQAYYDQQKSYLDPQWERQGNQMQAQLAAQGIMPGSQAYQNEMDQFNRDKTFAYQQAQDSAITNGQVYGLNRLNSQNELANSSQNRLQALASILPGYTGTGSAGVQAPDFASAAQNQYQGQLNAYNVSQQNAANRTNGLVAAGSTAAMAAAMMF